jgi:RNA polymerase sigma factor (sigma-70 family)
MAPTIDAMRKAHKPRRLTPAQQALAAANVGLVFWAVDRLCGPGPRADLDLDAMRGEGLLALCRAAGRYDRRKGRFSTWAYKCIRNAIVLQFRPSLKKIPKRTREASVNENGFDYAPRFESAGPPDADARAAWKLLDRLPARTAYVVAARMEGRTLQEIGDGLGLSRERICQIYHKGIRQCQRAAKRP